MARGSSADAGRCRQIVEAAPDVLFELDLDGTILSCSPSAQALSGWTPDELVGKSAFDLAHADDHARMRSILESKASSLMAPREYRIKTKSGEIRWVRVHARPIVEDGEVVRLLGVMGDYRTYAEEVELEPSLDEAVLAINEWIAEIDSVEA